jgi:hypothetical protein
LPSSRTPAHRTDEDGAPSAEVSHGFARRFPPLTVVTYDVDCDGIVDLTT